MLITFRSSQVDGDDSTEISSVSSWMTAIKMIWHQCINTCIFLPGSNDKFRSKFITERRSERKTEFWVECLWNDWQKCAGFANENDKPILNRTRITHRVTKITTNWFSDAIWEKTSLNKQRPNKLPPIKKYIWVCDCNHRNEIYDDVYTAWWKINKTDGGGSRRQAAAKKYISLLSGANNKFRTQ